MATYTVSVIMRADGAKNDTTFSAVNGNGLTSSSPLDVSNGDVITFSNTGSTSGTITGLSIFSDNSDISLAAGATENRTVTGTTLQADTVTAGNGSNTDDFFFERQLAEDPTDITFGADPGDFSATVSITATASGGAAGTLQVSDNNSTWVANGSSFTFTRGTAKTIYARVLKSDNTATGSYSESHTVGYVQPDLTVNINREPQGNLSSLSTDDVVCTISGGAAPARYRILRTTGGNQGMGNTGDLTGSNTSGTVTLHYSSQNTTDLPGVDSTYNYQIQAKILTSNGGENVWVNTNRSFQIRRLEANVYGFEYYNEQEKEVIAYDTNLGQFYAHAVATMPANTSSLAVSISGVSNNGLFHAYLTNDLGENLALSASDHLWNATFSNNTMTVTVSGTTSYTRDFRYTVIKTA